MEKINEFRGENFFLSNFYMANVLYNGCVYTNNEAAFQMQKTTRRNQSITHCEMGPSEAKAYGRRVELRRGWESVKIDIMRNIVYAKFTQNPELGLKLLATGDAYLEEGNTWGDRFWGTVNGKGENHLGKLLMEVRDKLRNPSNGFKVLVVLEETDPVHRFKGYIMLEKQYEQIFNAAADTLFTYIMEYTDQGYTVKCLDEQKGKEFLKNRAIWQQYLDAASAGIIWKYQTGSSFGFGKSEPKPVKTRINILEHTVCKLQKGFDAIVICDGSAKGVYELTSGGLVGDTVDQVNADIDACDDLSIMEEQIKEAAKIRDNEAVMVSNEEFGIQKNEV